MRRNAPLIAIPVIVGIVVLIVIGITISRTTGRPDVATVATQNRDADRDFVVNTPSSVMPRAGGGSSRPLAPSPPEAAPAPEAPRPVEVAAPVVDLNAPGSVNLVVLENGTKLPLPLVRVTLTPEDNPSAPLDPIQTDDRGAILVRGLAPGSYTVKMQWGFGPEADGGLFTVQPTERANHLAEYPARIPFKFKLVDEEDNPIAGQPMVVGLSLFEEAKPDANYTEEVRTASDGTFTVMGYENVRTHIVASHDAVLFSAPRGRGGWGGGGPMGGGWSNPYIDFRRQSADSEEPTVIVGRLNQVNAIGRIENSPKFESGQGFAAMVSSRGFRQMYIPVNGDDEVRFTAPPGEEVTVSLFRTRYAWSGGQSSNSTPGRMEFGAAPWNGMSVEHSQTVQMPDEPGQFVFQMELQDRITVNGVVYMPDGEPASGVEVIARGAAAAGQGGQRGGGGPGGGGDGRTMFRANRTDSDGRFSMDLTESPEYTFLIEQRTLPEDARTFDYPTLTWQEITEGEEVVLTLNYSALVWGEVVDETGRPLEGIQVRLGGTDLSRGARAVSSVSDSDGIFELNVPVSGDPGAPQTGVVYAYAIQRNESSGFAMAELNSQDPIQIMMYRDTEVIANVTADGSPMTSIQVRANFSLPEFGWAAGGGRQQRLTSENGVFTLGKYPRGVTTLVVSRPGSRQGEDVKVGESDGERLEVAIDLTGSPAGNEDGERGGGRGGPGGGGPGGGGPPPGAGGPSGGWPGGGGPGGGGPGGRIGPPAGN